MQDAAPDIEALRVRRASFLRIERLLAEECEAMTAYALSAGIPLPPELLQIMESQIKPGQTTPSLICLGQVHGILSELILPATPRAVSLIHMQKIRHPLLTAFGPIPLVRWLLFAAIVSVLIMLLTALSPAINTQSMKSDFLDGSGAPLLLCELFLLSASAIGTSFAVLFKLNKYISDGTYDPRYSSTYFIQLVLGVIAGVMLSQLLFHELIRHGSSASTQEFDQPILALIGGFSSSLVYRILNRILLAVESLFGGQAKPAGMAGSRLPNRSKTLECEPRTNTEQ